MINGIYELEDLGDLQGKKVLVRVDFNVPLSGGEITDDLRIRAALPTITWLEDHGAIVTLCSHLGRPKGEKVATLSLDPVRKALAGHGVKATLLENLRFNAGEKANDEAFVQTLVADNDFYVNDAFGVCHRDDASVVGPPQFLPSASGRLVTKEVAELHGLLHEPARPFFAVMGGAKISDKLQVIESLLSKVDGIIIGGGMAYSFLKAQGHSIGSSLVEDAMLETCAELLTRAVPIYLPTDFVAMEDSGKLCDAQCRAVIKNVGKDIPDGWMGADIGPESAAIFADLLDGAKSVFWNGPMGVFEDPRFAAGTEVIATTLAGSEAFTVIGGGDSAAAAAKIGVADQFDHVSTGGGASLELIQNGDLTGLKALRASAERFSL